jgi:hypothetical protein
MASYSPQKTRNANGSREPQQKIDGPLSAPPGLQRFDRRGCFPRFLLSIPAAQDFVGRKPLRRGAPLQPSKRIEV